MIDLPKTTEFNKRIPKQKFYENLNISQSLKKVFVEQVKVIYWKNKIAPSTMNIAPGNNVTELEVFEIRLNSPNLDEAFFRQIDKEIPYHILFILECDGKQKAVIGYKEESSGNVAFKVNSYYSTDWVDADSLNIKVDGLSIDVIYENFIRQIAGDALITATSGESIKESIGRDEKRQALQKQIYQLYAKIRKEKQLNRQIQMNSELKLLKKELEELTNG